MKCGIAFCQIPVEEGNTYCTQRHGKLNQEKQKAAKVYQIPKVSEKRKKELKGKSTISKGKKTGVNDAKLWKVFSLYIRLRDCDKNGFVKCITSGKYMHYKEADAGHFISRRYWATRYNEKNVNAQGRFANRFNQGEQFAYAQAVDRKWGKGTAELLYNLSKISYKVPTQFEIDQLTIYYLKEVEKLTKEKGIDLKQRA